MTPRSRDPRITSSGQPGQLRESRLKHQTSCKGRGRGSGQSAESRHSRARSHSQPHHLLMHRSLLKLREGEAFEGSPGVLRLAHKVLPGGRQLHAVVQDGEDAQPVDDPGVHAPLAQVDQELAPSRRESDPP